ncbi:alpha/beta hydrolase [Streptomyces sp. 796.1]|uniref:alpha/beta hydrolase n=1 Tax=Streptomyces sp. 796.1 TaxID=3163029 RepID=UPI0039C91C9B
MPVVGPPGAGAGPRPGRIARRAVVGAAAWGAVLACAGAATARPATDRAGAGPARTSTPYGAPTAAPGARPDSAPNTASGTTPGAAPGSTSRSAPHNAPRSVDVTLRLPAPSGPYPIGARVLHLVDPERADPWRPGTRREVMVTVWYPARGGAGRPLVPQMTARAAASFADWAPRLHPGLLPATGVDWAATLTHARRDAPVRAGRRRPVLLYTPGGGEPRTLGTCLAEELASHGSIVVTIDHPGDASEVEFPDGTLRETEFRGDPRADPELFATVIAVRIADVRFVLDRLLAAATGAAPGAGRRALPRGLAQAIDPHRVGVYGHSAGGTTAAQALYDDRRIGAAVNLEGHLSHPGTPAGRPGPLFPVAAYGVDRPLLLVGTDGFRDAEYERSWSAMLGHPRGRTTWRQLSAANHATLTDHAALAPQLQRAGLITEAQRNALVGAAPPTRSIPLLRHLVRGFFARHLGAR